MSTIFDALAAIGQRLPGTITGIATDAAQDSILHGYGDDPEPETGHLLDDDWYAQTFTCTQTMTCTGFKLFYSTIYENLGAISGAIYMTDGTEPTTYIASGASEEVGGPGSGWIEIEMTEPVVLVKGTVYAIAFLAADDAKLRIYGHLTSAFTGWALSAGEGIEDWNTPDPDPLADFAFILMEQGDQFTVEDTHRLIRYADNTFVNGLLFILSGDAAGAILPVTDSDQSSAYVKGDIGLYWDQAGTEKPAAGDRYAVMPNVFGYGAMISALDEALRAFGMVETEVALGTGDGQTKTWDLPMGYSGEVVRVKVYTEDGDYGHELTQWEETASGVETTWAVSSGDVVKAVIRYMPADFDTAGLAGEIPESIPLEYVGWYGCYAAMRMEMMQPGHDAETYQVYINHASEMAQNILKTMPYTGPRAKQRFMR